MSSFVLKTLTLFTLIALYLENIHGAKPDSPVSKSVEETSAQPTEEAGNDTESSPSLETNAVVVNLTTHIPSGKKQKFSSFYYQLSDEHNAKLSVPNTIEKIIFDGFELEFKDPTKLPDRNVCESLDIFVCEHNHPFLIRFLLQGDNHYYYNMDLENKKFKNCGIGKSSYVRKNDDNGLTYYSPPQSNNTVKHVESGIEHALKSISKKFCKEHKKTKETLSVPSIKVLSISLEEIGKT